MENTTTEKLTFAEKLALQQKAKQKQQQKQQQNIEKQRTTKRGILHGSGITQRVLQKTEKEYEESTNSQQQNIDVDKMESLPDFAVDTMADVVYDDDQLNFIKTLGQHQYVCGIGAAGVGKTTCVKGAIRDMIDIVPKINIATAQWNPKGDVKAKLVPSILICSYAAKGGENTKRAFAKEFPSLISNVLTMHRAVGMHPEKTENEDGEEKMKMIPLFTKQNPMPWDVIIIDECSIPPAHFWNNSFGCAIKPSTKIIFLGDINQISGVGGYGILGFGLNKWPSAVLTKVYRNAGSILENAHRVLAGKMPIPSEDFVIIPIRKDELAAFSQTKNMMETLIQRDKLDFMQDAIVVPTNVGTHGQTHYNEFLTYRVNSKAARISIEIGGQYRDLAVGDRIMVTNNNKKEELFNGMTGLITEIKPNEHFLGESENVASFDDVITDTDIAEALDFMSSSNSSSTTETDEKAQHQASHIVKCLFEGQEKPRSFQTVGALETIAHCYGLTGHKAQGSEYRKVISVVHSSNKGLINREWLYTMITRAKTKILIFAEPGVLQACIRKQAIPGKTVQDKINKFAQITRQKEKVVAHLPEPREITLTELLAQTNEKG